jgi:hypothetical protein
MHKARSFFYVCAGLLCLALAYHLGARGATAEGAAAPEIAILTGTVPDGGTIPLPHYADGSEALESECRWIVSPNTATATLGMAGGLWCYTSGRVVAVGMAGSGSSIGVANYLIIATRAAGVVGVQRVTLGELKARYR